MVMLGTMAIAARTVYEFLGYQPADVARLLTTAVTNKTAAVYQFTDSHNRNPATGAAPKYRMTMFGPEQAATAIDAAEHLTAERRAQLKVDFAAHPMMQPSARIDTPCIAVFELTADSSMIGDEERAYLAGVSNINGAVRAQRMFRIIGAEYSPLALCTATVPPAQVYPFAEWSDVEQVMSRYSGDTADCIITATITEDGFADAISHIAAAVTATTQPCGTEMIEYPRPALLSIMPMVARAADPLAQLFGDFMMYTYPK